MKKFSPLSVLGILAFGVALISCKKQQPLNELNFNYYTASASFSLGNSAEDFGTDTDLIVTDSISLILPEMMANGLSGEVLRESILSMAIDSVDVKDPAAAIRGFANDSTLWAGMGDYEVKRLDSSVSVHNSNGYTVTEGNVVYLTPQLLSYRIMSSSYMPGAAHGMYTARYINYYQPDGGKILTLEDIFTPEGLKQLPARIAEQAKDEYEDASIDSLPDGGNFFISPNGEIVFVYQPYEVASYATGLVKVAFYPLELSDIMTDFGNKVFNLIQEEDF